LRLTERTQSTLEEEAASLRKERDHLPSVELKRAGALPDPGCPPSYLYAANVEEGRFYEVRMQDFA
jgi:hypothetical protein